MTGIRVLLALITLLLACSPTAAQDGSSPASIRVERPGPPLLPPASPRIKTYNNTWYALYFAGVVWEIAGLSLLLRLRVGPRLRDAAERRTRNRIFQTVLFYIPYSLLLAIWHMPLGLVGYGVDRSYGFATQSVGLWLEDRGRAWLLGLPMVVALWFAYWLVRTSPKRWWVWLASIAAPWLAVQAALWPVVVAPMYNRFTPMAASPLRTRLLQLAGQAGIGNAEVLVVNSSKRSTKLNAYVAGLGPTHRIVLYDTTLRALGEDEVVAITGHEIGHYVLRHVWWNVVSSTTGAFLILAFLSRAFPWSIRRWGDRLGLRGIDDLAGLPLVSLWLYAIVFLQTPVAAGISRYQEHEADRFGLELTGLNEATARAFIAFVNRDYADPDPPRFIVFWFYTHPPLRERVDFALSYGQRRVIQTGLGVMEPRRARRTAPVADGTLEGRP